MPRMTQTAIRPFTFRVPDDAIAALKTRLAATRWPDEVNDESWGWGIPLATLQAICAYWQTEFDWREPKRACSPIRISRSGSMGWTRISSTLDRRTPTPRR
jgi:hypothetical protein